MRDQPLAVILSEQYCEPGRAGERLAFRHSGKLVKSSDDDSIVVEDDCSSLLNLVLIAASSQLNPREISANRIDTF